MARCCFHLPRFVRAICATTTTPYCVQHSYAWHLLKSSIFSIDEHISREVLDVVLAELAGWPSGRGNALPEWLLSMACERLRLHSFHTPILLEAVRTAELPEWLAQLAGRIRSD